MTRTAGALYCTWECGVTFWWEELFGTEALGQVVKALVELVGAAAEAGIELPAQACYDDACHLVLYLMKRQHLSQEAQLLACMDWTVDRFHFPNHTYVAALQACACGLRKRGARN